MRRLLAVFVAALGGLFFVGPAFAQSPPLIYVANQSTLIPQADVDAALPAFQISVSRDLAAVWGTDAWLTTNPEAKDDADMTIYLVDEPTVYGALGFHEVSLGMPVAWIFARTNIQYGEDWRLTFSHELDEMLVDPWINRYSWFNKRQWLVEVCDPPESGLFAYWINGVPLSDFIYPRWYDPTLKGRFDYTGHIRRAGQILKGGYASFLRPDGTYGQVTNWRKLPEK